MKNAGAKCRSAVMAGIFYPEEQKAARDALTGLGLGQGPMGCAQAILAPHAGWDISGTVAAAAFNAAMERKPDTVVMLGPIHGAHETGIYLSDSDSFQTPVGDLPVDTELCEELSSCSTLMRVNDIPHLYEHSIEVLLPLVKYCFPDAVLVPILVGGNGAAAAAALPLALDLVFASRMDTTLFVVSTNLSDHLEDEISRAQGAEFLRLVEGLDRDGILEGLAAGRISACGAACAAALLGCRSLSGCGARTVARASSGGARSDDPRTVHYAAVAFG